MHPEGTHLCGPAARGARGGRGGREARPFHWVPAATRPASPVHPSLLCRRGSRGHRSAPESGSLEAEETLTVTRRQQVSGEHHWLPSPFSGERAADHRWARAALTREATPACRTYMQLGQGSLRRPCKAQGLTVQALTAAHPQQVRQRTLPVCSERKGTETPLSRADVVGTGPEPAEKESGRGGGPGQERDAEAAGRASAGRQARPP